MPARLAIRGQEMICLIGATASVNHTYTSVGSYSHYYCFCPGCRTNNQNISNSRYTNPRNLSDITVSRHLNRCR